MNSTGGAPRPPKVWWSESRPTLTKPFSSLLAGMAEDFVPLSGQDHVQAAGEGLDLHRRRAEVGGIGVDADRGRGFDPHLPDLVRLGGGCLMPPEQGPGQAREEAEAAAVAVDDQLQAQ